MIYKVVILRNVVRQLEKLPAKDYHAIKLKILALAENPRPGGCEKLKGREGFRIRHGNYRIIYDIQETILTVRVIKIGHRKDIYR
ncbi:MAG: type II toxin-antitoxin system RelE family toxin [Tangfeifania sp.]